MGAYFETNRQYIQKFGDVFQVVGYLAGPRLKGAASSDDTPTEKENPKVKNMSPEEKRAYDVKQLQHKKSQLKSKMYANEWEYTIVLSQCKKHDPASQWDNFKRQFAGIKYLAIPVKKQEGFIIAAVVSGAAKEKMENAKNCLCMVYPFESGHREKLIDILQNVDGKSYFCSRGLAETPKREYTWKLQTDQWDSVRGYCAVANFSTMEEAEYFLREGKRMESKQLKAFRESTEETKDIIQKKGVYRYDQIPLYLSGKLFYEEREIEIEDGWAKVLIARDESGYIVWSKINNGGFYMYDSIPCVYFISKKMTKEQIENEEKPVIYYVGQTKNPIGRYCNHFGLNPYLDQKNGTQFYKFITNNGLSFDDYDITFITIRAFMNELGDIYEFTSPYKNDFFESQEQIGGKKLYDTEMVEAQIQQLFLDMEKDGVLKIYRNGAYPIFLSKKGGLHKKKDDKLIEYKEEYGSLAPIYYSLRQNALTLSELLAVIREKERKQAFERNASAQELAFMTKKFVLENEFLRR